MLAHDVVGKAGDGAQNGDRTTIHGVKTIADLAAKINVLLNEQDAEPAVLPEAFHVSPISSMIEGWIPSVGSSSMMSLGRVREGARDREAAAAGRR